MGEQTFFVYLYYIPHFNCAPQLVHVLHPPTSATCPLRQTGQRSPISEPIVTLVLSNSWIVSTNTTLGVASKESVSSTSSKVNCSASNVSTWESRLPST